MKLARLLLISVSLVLIASHTPPVLAETVLGEPGGTGTTPAHDGASSPAAAVGTQTNPLPTDTRYRVQRGDVIELNFPFVTDFNQTITVQPDGFVTLRVIGPLRAEGMTVPELADKLRAEYSSILRSPVITVELKDFQKPYFIVAGAVEGPGKYDLRGDMTVTEGVAVAGGLTRGAQHSRAMVFRRLASGEVDTTRVDLKRMLKKADLRSDVRLQSGDLLFIPGNRHGVGAREVFSVIGVVLSSVWIVTQL